MDEVGGSKGTRILIENQFISVAAIRKGVERKDNAGAVR